MATSGDGEEEGRTKHLTPKAYEQYLGEVDKYSQALATLSRENDRLISILLSSEASHEEKASSAAQLEETTNKYMNLSDCYIDYLKRKNTLDSQRELISHQLIRSVNMHKTETAMNYSLSKLEPPEPTQAFTQTGEQMEKVTTTKLTDVQMKQELKKEPNVSNSVRSQSSRSSRRSGRSNASCSSTMMRQKAHLEAARKRLEYVDQESTLVQKKAQLEANTTIEKAKLEKMTKELEAKRDVAVAEAELQAMEEVFDESDRETEVSSPSLTEQRTAKYIIEQSKHVNRQYEVHNSAPAVNNIDTQTFLLNEENMNEELPVHNSAPAVNNINTQTLLRNEEHMNEELPIPLTRKIASPVTSANQIVQQIHKEVIEQLPDTNNNRTLSLNYGQELSKFLMKKDLIISRLLKYDDRPENYLSWKDTFKCVIDTYVAPKNEDKPFKTRQFAVKKTNVSQDKHEPHANENSKMRCAIHNSDHLLDECRAFRHMSIVDRRALLKKNGETCLDGAHYPSTVNAMKTFVQQDGRPSILEPCDNSIHISEKLSTSLFKLEPDDNRQADDASRSIRPEKLNQSQWLIGPTQFLCKKNTIDSETEGDEFPLILPEEDREVRVAKTLVTKLAIGSKRFERFSQWKTLVSAIQTLRCFIIKQTNRQDSSKTDSLQDAHNLVIGTVQREIFNVEYSALMNKQKLPANSKILQLDPFIDENGLLRLFTKCMWLHDLSAPDA
ncbi:unnamed protein product [Mytilus edulis]|uniref:Uncharacterized protein n=1 Tax=Mytilus edulis TaxID=6550 RepID=A0A8S3U9L1_MYTED|nr:unnamed protein product [Mytilus edulis]